MLMAGKIYLNLMEQYRYLYGNAALCAEYVSKIIADGVHYAAVVRQHCSPEVIVDLDELGQTTEFVEQVYNNVIAIFPLETVSRVLRFQTSDEGLIRLLQKKA